MKNIILSMMVSLDGYIETTEKDISWHNWNAEMDDYMTDFFQNIDTIILGRKAYELMASYWPTPAAESENPLIAHKMNKLNKLVFSKSLQSSEWRNTTILDHVSSYEIQKLKQRNAKDLVIFGGADIAQTFLNLSLVDELQLIINPVLLGNGTALFGNNEDIRKKLSLIKTVTTKMGNVIVCYKVISKPNAVCDQ